MGFELADDSKTSSRNPESERTAFPSMLSPGEGLSGSPIREKKESAQSTDSTWAASAVCAGYALKVWRANPLLGPAEIVAELKKENSPCVSKERKDSFIGTEKPDSPVDSKNVEPKPRSLKDYREKIEQEERELGAELISPWNNLPRREESLFSFGFSKNKNEIVPMKKVPYLPKDDWTSTFEK